MRWLKDHYSPQTPTYTRRGFIRSIGGTGAGLVLAVHIHEAAAQSGAAAILRADSAAAGPAFNGFVRVAPDNTVTVLIKHLEMGQGPHTGLTTLVAEELDADWSQMRATHAPADAKLYANTMLGIQGTGGSTAIANSYEQMRQAGAAARAMLIDACAQTWNLLASEISVDKGVLSHRASKRQATFGQMAEAASKITPPTDVKLKDSKQFKLIGKNIARLDSSAKTNGKALFTLDVDRPGMLTVVVAHPPRFGATVASVDDVAARKVRGVVDVKTIPQGVAVYANGFWAAKKGSEALRVTWDESKAEKRGTPELLSEYRARAATAGTVAKVRGDVSKGLSGAKVFEAEYIFPYLAHAPMEPLDCVIELQGGACRASFGSQLQTVDHQTIAKTLGLPPDRVAIETLYAGGSFGRRAQPSSHLAAEAAAALKALGRDGAVKLVWTREDDTKGGYYRPMFVHRIKAALDSSGNIAAWDHTIVGQSFIKGSPFESMMIKDGLDPTMTEGASDLPYSIADFRTTVHTMEVGVPTLWWRSVGHTHTAYATETMIDELLVAGGKDPVQGRLALLKEHPRELGVLRAVAQAAKWNGSKTANGKARGVAVHKSFNTYVAHIVEVSRGSDGLPKVERVWCAVDCGVAVNPDNIKSQIEGGAGFGIGSVLYDEITLDQGRVVQSNFHNYRMLRINEMPKVDVVIVPSTEKPTGVGEPGVPTIGPAVANAWRALTGTAVRHLPFARGTVERDGAGRSA